LLCHVDTRNCAHCGERITWSARLRRWLSVSYADLSGWCPQSPDDTHSPGER